MAVSGGPIVIPIFAEVEVTGLGKARQQLKAYLAEFSKIPAPAGGVSAPQAQRTGEEVGKAVQFSEQLAASYRSQIPGATKKVAKNLEKMALEVEKASKEIQRISEPFRTTKLGAVAPIIPPKPVVVPPPAEKVRRQPKIASVADAADRTAGDAAERKAKDPYTKWLRAKEKSTLFAEVAARDEEAISLGVRGRLAEARARRAHLKKFDTATESGRQNTEELASTAVRERLFKAQQTLAEQAATRSKLGQRMLQEEASAAAETKVAGAKARQAVAEQFDVTTKAGRQRAVALAEATAVERKQQLVQRQLDIGAQREDGGVRREAVTKQAEEAFRRDVSIEQTRLALAESNVKEAAKEKVLLEQLNRAIAQEVRNRESISEVARENLAVARQARQVRSKERELETPADRSEIAQARLGEAARKRLIDAEVRAGQDVQAIAAENADVQRRQIAQRRADLGHRTPEDVEQEATSNVEQRLAAAQVRLAEHTQLRTTAGQKTLQAEAEVAAADRLVALAQRQRETAALRAAGGVQKEATTAHGEAAYRRDVSIAQTKLALEDGTVKELAKEKLLLEQLNRAVGEEVRKHQDIGAIARDNLDKEREKRAIRASERRQETPADISGIAQNKLGEAARQRAIDAEIRAGKDVAAIAAENADIQRRRVAQGRADLQARTPADVQDTAIFAVEQRLATANARLAENAELRTVAGQRTLQAEAQLATETAELKAQRSKLAATDQRLIAAEASAANAREEQAARVGLVRGGANVEEVSALGRDDLLAVAAVRQRALADQHRARIVANTTGEEIEAAAQKKLAEAKLRAAINSRERELFSEAARSGGGNANWFQKLQARLTPGAGKLPEEQMKFGQFLGSKFQTTVGFAASGMLLGGAIAGISEMFKDATQLEQVFVRLRGQLEGIGQAQSFESVREGIRSIAVETGQSSSDVAAFFSRMVGVTQNPAKALADTSSAMKLATVTGLDMKTMLQSIVPIQKAFGVSAQTIGDEVVAMGEKFGIAEDDLVQFLGKTASVAKGAGLGFKELTIIGANVANSLGKPIDSASESINKAFGQIENNSMKIFSILQQNPATEGAIPQMVAAMGQGQTGQALIELLRASQAFTSGQKNAIMTNVVSRREAEEFNALLQNAGPILQQLEQAQDGTNDSAGKLNARFRDLKETVALTFKTISAAFESMGEALLRSGLGHVLMDIGTILATMVGAVGLLVRAFSKLNEIMTSITGVPIAGTLARMGLVTLAIVKGYGLMVALKNKSMGSSKGETAAETENLKTKGQLSGAAGQTAAAEGKLAAAKTESAAASKASTATAGTIGGPASPFRFATTGAGAVAGTGPAGATSVAANLRGAGPIQAPITTPWPNVVRQARIEEHVAAANASKVKAIRLSTQAETNAALTSRFVQNEQRKRIASIASAAKADPTRLSPSAARAMRSTFETAPVKMLPPKYYNLMQEKGFLAQKEANVAQQAATEVTKKSAGATAETVTGASVLAKAQRTAAQRLAAAEQESLRVAQLPPPPPAPVSFRPPAQLDQAALLAADARRAGLTRTQRLLSATGLQGGYDRTYSQSERLFAEQKAAGTLSQANFASRAMAGSAILPSGRQDAQIAATGQAKALSAGWMAAIAAAAILAFKSAYDEQRSEVQANVEGLKTQLREMNSADVKKMADERTDIWDDIQNAFFGVDSKQEILDAEKASVDARQANVLIGGPVRVEPTKGPVDATKQYLKTRRDALNEIIADRLAADEKTRNAVLDELTEYDEPDQSPFQRLFSSVDITKSTQRSNIKAGVDSGLLTRRVPHIDIDTKDPGLFERFYMTPIAAWNNVSDSMVGEGETTKENMKKLLDNLKDKTDPESQKTKIRIGKLLAEGGDTKEIDAIAKDLQDQGDVAGAILASGKEPGEFLLGAESFKGQAIKPVDELAKEFQAGKISQGSYLSQLDGSLKTLRLMAAGLQGPEGEKARAALLDQERIMTDLLDKGRMSTADLVGKLGSYGKSRPKTVVADTNLEAISKLSIQARIDSLQSLIDGDIGRQEETWQRISDPVARAQAIAQGVNFTPLTKQTFYESETKKSTSAEEAITKAAPAFKQTEDSMRKMLAERAAKEGITMSEAANRYIDEQVASARAAAEKYFAEGRWDLAKLALDRANRAEATRSYLPHALEGVAAFPDTAQDPDQAAADLIDATARKRQSLGRIEAAKAGGDTLKSAAIAAKEASAAHQDAIGKRGVGKADDADVNDAYAAKISADKAQSDAFFDYTQLIKNRQVILANGDPVAENAAQMAIALAALNRARGAGDLQKAEEASQQVLQLELQAAENQRNIVRGAMAVTAATVGEDPFRAAQEALKAAEYELANAHGEADREQRLAAVIQAKQSLQNAVSNSLSADAQLAITLANLRNDPIAAATIAADEAKRKLDEAVAKGIQDRTVLAPLEGALAEANKQAFLAPINKQIEDLDWLYNMQQVGLGDYVTGLEAQLSQLDVNSKEYRDLALKIFNLKKGAQSELQWNLPGNLELPTLYEARRASETNYNMGSGLGYQDNRNVSVSIAVNGTDNPVAVANQVVSALQNSLRGGNTYTANVPLSAGL